MKQMRLRFCPVNKMINEVAAAALVARARVSFCCGIISINFIIAVAGPVTIAVVIPRARVTVQRGALQQRACAAPPAARLLTLTCSRTHVGLRFSPVCSPCVSCLGC